MVGRAQCSFMLPAPPGFVPANSGKCQKVAVWLMLAVEDRWELSLGAIVAIPSQGTRHIHPFLYSEFGLHFPGVKCDSASASCQVSLLTIAPEIQTGVGTRAAQLFRPNQLTKSIRYTRVREFRTLLRKVGRGERTDKVHSTYVRDGLVLIQNDAGGVREQHRPCDALYVDKERVWHPEARNDGRIQLNLARIV